MTIIVGCILLILIIVLLTIFFAITIYIEKMEIQFLFFQENVRISIVKKAIDLSITIKTKSSELNDFPILEKYLEQLSRIIKEDIYDFVDLTVIPLSENNDKEFIKKFLFEFNKAPRKIKKYVISLSDILEQIYILKNLNKKKFIAISINKKMRVSNYIKEKKLEKIKSVNSEERYSLKIDSIDNYLVAQSA